MVDRAEDRDKVIDLMVRYRYHAPMRLDASQGHVILLKCP